MNKRLKKKLGRTKNLKRQNELLNMIAEKFTIASKKFGNGYFIFNLGENTVCHFLLKETLDWKFGIWLNGNQFQIFGEHIDLIDKFKPSATYISCENDIQGFMNEVEKISHNPKLYFVDSLTRGEALLPYEKYEDLDGYYGYQVVRHQNEETKLWDVFVRDKTITQETFVEKEWNEYFESKRKKKEDKEFDKNYVFDFFAELPNTIEEITAIGVKDKNLRGFRCSPQYELIVTVSEDITQERFDEIFNELDELIYQKNISQERKTYDYRFSFERLTDSIDSIKNCNYKFFKRCA